MAGDLPDSRELGELARPRTARFLLIHAAAADGGQRRGWLGGRCAARALGAAELGRERPGLAGTGCTCWVGVPDTTRETVDCDATQLLVTKGEARHVCERAFSVGVA